MRIHASVAVVGGALALSALAVPAAQADGGYGDTKITKVVVNGDNKVSVNSTTSTCTASVTVDPKVDYYSNKNAGTWYVDAFVNAKDGDFVWREKAGSFWFQRAAKLTVNAAPEPVRKGRTLTVTGTLTRANWESLKYGGHGSQSVKLQFRKKGTSTYTTLKTITADSAGNLRTTTTATADGYYRFSFAGNSTTSAVSAAGDFVDVQ
ncbi:calcium-binding protein [Streptomyces sp. NPDC002076]